MALMVRSAEASDLWIAEGDTLPMRLLRDDAQRLGAVHLAVRLDGHLLLHDLMVGEGDLASVMAELTQHAEQGRRMGDPTRWGFALGALLLAAGLRADRPALTELLARCQPGTGDAPSWLEETGDLDVAEAICLALEGRDGKALTVMENFARRYRAGRPNYYSYPLAPMALLATLAGTASLDQVLEALRTSGQVRWNRQFLHWAAAVHAGQRGELDCAASHAEQAAKAAEIYPVSRHLAARLTAPAAASDGWGNPIEDLRAAEAWFHQNGIPVAARSCRDVLRTLGAPVQQRRAGTDTMPSQLRATGVTVREYEICLLLCEHLDNRTIGQRLHISHRTVESHIAALLAKLCVPDRRALIHRIETTRFASKRT
jgi:DNA-binding CsgD family transcriptional regulator